MAKNIKNTGKRTAAVAGKRSPKPILVIVLSAALVLAVALATFGSYWSRMDAGRINGNAVPLEELQLYADDARSVTIAYFNQKYKANSNSEGFWDTDFDGVTPRAYLLDTAKQNLLTDRTIREQAASHGIEAAVDFRSQKEAFAAENKDRAEKSENGQAIYGPTQYTMAQFLSYQRTALTDDLKKALLETDLKPTEQDLRDAYSKLDKTILDKGYQGTVARFICTNPAKEAQAFESVKEFIKQGKSVQETISGLSEKFGSELTVTEVELTPEIHREDTSLLALYDECRDLLQGSFLEPQETAQGTELYYMEAKEDFGLMTFEEAGDYSSNKWINDNINDYITQKASQSQVSWNDTVLSRIQVS